MSLCLRCKCTGKNDIVNRKFYFFENEGEEQNFIWRNKPPHGFPFEYLIVFCLYQTMGNT